LTFFQVIAAEGEQKASKALREAAETIAGSHAALQVNLGQGYFANSMGDFAQGHYRIQCHIFIVLDTNLHNCLARQYARQLVLQLHLVHTLISS
jgi:hypothetical protein